MPATTLNAYLIIAHYNHEKWTSLSLAEREEAERAAENLFPERRIQALLGGYQGHEVAYEKDSRYANAPEEHPLPYPPGVRMVQTFYSSFHSRVPASFEQKSAKMGQREWDERDALVLQMLEELPPKITDASTSEVGLELDEPRVGWMAIIDAEAFPLFVVAMGGKTGPLCRMYDLQLIPLNDDRTTADIYSFMTPVHWSS